MNYNFYKLKLIYFSNNMDPFYALHTFIIFPSDPVAIILRGLL